MRRIPRFKKRTWVLAAVVAVIAAMASIGAYAYWTSTGTGSGTAVANAGANNLVITSTSPSGVLKPAGSVAVNGNVHNPNTYSVNVDTVSSTSITTSDVNCLPADFHFAPVVVNQTVAAGGDQAFTGSLTMDDTPVNQDACKSATITINFASTSS
jgi:hypothetical protein